MITPTAAGANSREQLYQSWSKLRSQRPYFDLRELAAELGVSAARLIAARCEYGEGSALAPAPAALLARVATFGTVTARTRSSAASLQNVGAYGLPDIGEHTGIVIGDNIDLRVFPSGWKSAYALTESTLGGLRHSLHIFDAAGAATHEVVLGSDANKVAFDQLLRDFAQPNSEPFERASSSPSAASPDRDVDVDAYRRAYGAMQDTHDFFMLLHRFGLTREHGLRLAGPAYARAIAVDAHRKLFAAAADASIPLMIFVANSGMVQIASGTIPYPSFSATSCSLENSRFTLRLSEAGVARAWAVGKPTVNGIVTSLELYTADGGLITQIFGERHAGEPERADWLAAMSGLPNLG